MLSRVFFKKGNFKMTLVNIGMFVGLFTLL